MAQFDLLLAGQILPRAIRNFYWPIRRLRREPNFRLRFKQSKKCVKSCSKWESKRRKINQNYTQKGYKELLNQILLAKKSKIYICYLPAGRSVQEKYFVEVSKTARGRRPRDVFETETKHFSVRTDLNGK